MPLNVSPPKKEGDGVLSATGFTRLGRIHCDMRRAFLYCHFPSSWRDINAFFLALYPVPARGTWKLLGLRKNKKSMGQNVSIWMCCYNHPWECLCYISIHYGPPSVVHYMSHDAPFSYAMKKTTAILEEVAKQRVLDKEKIKKIESNWTMSIRHHHSNSRTKYFGSGIFATVVFGGFFFSSFCLSFPLWKNNKEKSKTSSYFQWALSWTSV